MPITTDDIEKAGTWTWRQVRRALLMQAIFGLVVTALAGFGAYWYAAYVDISDRIEKELSDFEVARAGWIAATDEVLSKANPNSSDAPSLPTIAELREVGGTVNSLISELNSVPTPTYQIEAASERFRGKLFEIVREIGRYEGTAEGATRLVEASQAASVAGGAHRKAIEDYLGSAVERLRGALF